jgi:hypothetical protein
MEGYCWTGQSPQRAVVPIEGGGGGGVSYRLAERGNEPSAFEAGREFLDLMI